VDNDIIKTAFGCDEFLRENNRINILKSENNLKKAVNKFHNSMQLDRLFKENVYMIIFEDIFSNKQ
jgi:hypothetical protein